jgi:hypothetical protein
MKCPIRSDALFGGGWTVRGGKGEGVGFRGRNGRREWLGKKSEKNAKSPCVGKRLLYYLGTFFGNRIGRAIVGVTGSYIQEKILKKTLARF